MSATLFGNPLQLSNNSNGDLVVSVLIDDVPHHLIGSVGAAAGPANSRRLFRFPLSPAAAGLGGGLETDPSGGGRWRLADDDPLAQ